MDRSVLIAATLGAIAAPAEQAPPPPPDAPITLVTEAVATGVRVQVVGRAATGVAARYSLEVSSAGSRTVQRGSVRLRPGETTILLTSTLGGDRRRAWTAQLRVEPEGAPAYQVSRSS